MRALIAILLMAGTATAEDYPFTGLLFASPVEQGTPPSVATHVVPASGLETCAATVIDQRADGRFTIYILDYETFRATGEIAYDPVYESKCTIAGNGVETCTMVRKSPGLSDEAVMYDIPMAPTATGMDVVIYYSKEDAEARLNAGGYYALHRCPVNADIVRTGFRTELSTLGEDEINAIRYGSERVRKDPATHAVMKVIGE